MSVFSLRRAGNLAAVLSFACAALAHAQQMVRVESRVSCPKCTIELKKVATIGGSGDTAFIFGGLTTVARDSRGWFYVGPTRQQSIQIYDGAGRYQRTVGRRGNGPGEMSMILAFATTTGDTLVVLDVASGVNIFSPTHTFIRRGRPVTPRAQPTSIVALPGGQMAMGVIGPPGFQPVRVIDSASRTVREFGRPVADTSHQPRYWFPIVFGGATGNIWIPQSTEYRFDEWSAAGKPVRTIVRAPDWFRAWTPEEHRKPQRFTDPPRPWLVGGYQDASGLLWTVSLVPDAGWRKARIDVVRGPEGVDSMIPDDEQVRYEDTMIEVLDPNNGALLVSRRLDQKMRPVAGGPFLYTIHYDANGEASLEIYAMTLVGRPPTATKKAGSK